MANTINKHWSDGGTGVTNFGADERPLYEAAVKEYGKPYMVIHEEAMPCGPINVSDMYSLHDLRQPNNQDLGDFWRVFDEIQSKMSKRVALDEREAK